MHSPYYICQMQKWWQLVSHEFRMDFKSQHILWSILLFSTACIYTLYLVYPDIQETKVFISFGVLSAVFSGFHTMQKDQQRLSKGQLIYWYTLVHPRTFVMAKMTYNAFFVFLLNLLQALLLIFYFGGDAFHPSSLLQLFLAISLGSTAMGIGLTMASAIAQRTQQPTTILAILGFALLMPTLFAYVSLLNGIMMGAIHFLAWPLIIIMNVIPFLLSSILFPYLWRE
jgi:heme exporter protein B